MSASLREAPGAWLAIALPHGEDARGLALWAMRYSPLVSLCTHTRLGRVGVVVEVAGSAHLFGGLDRLLEDAQSRLVERSPDAVCAGAPTAAGAWALACCKVGAWVEAGQWRACLEALPLTALDLPDEDHTLLTQVGLRTVGGCMALPRGDLDRRCRLPVTVQLDHLSGGAPEPRHWFIPPASYDRTAELLHETWHADALLFAGRRLLAELEGLLRGSGRAVQRMRFVLGHAPGASDTVFELALTRPLQDLTPVGALLRERLSRLRLPSPVRRVGLAATPLDAWQPRTPELWPGAEDAALQRGALLDRLRARLGSECVRTLEPVSDHRPELAWRGAVMANGDDRSGVASANGDPVDARRPPVARRRGTTAPACRGLRPLWLLAEPTPLADVPGDWREERGPERVESGWWQSPAARDYYVLKDTKGRRLWAYRTSTGGWFAQGWFA